MLHKSILVTVTLLLVSGCAREAPAPTLNGTDAAWIQLMIPMNEQAVPLLELAVQRAGGSAWPTLALQIRETHQAELVRLRGLRDQAGLPSGNVHSGHDMPGLVSAGDLAEIGQAAGPAFTRLLADTLHEHLQQSERLAKSEQAAGADVAARALAAEIAAAREAQLVQLRKCCESALQTPSI